MEMAAYERSRVYLNFWLLISTAHPTTDITTARPLLHVPWSPRHLHQSGTTRAQDTGEESQTTEEQNRAQISASLALKSAIAALLELTEFAPWPEEAHARLPDGHHGAWLLPLPMEATTAAVVPGRRSLWASLAMIEEETLNRRECAPPHGREHKARTTG